MATSTPQQEQLQAAFREFAQHSDPITQHKTAKLFFPVERNWQQPIDILPADELAIKLPLIEAFFKRVEAHWKRTEAQPAWEPPKPPQIAALLQFESAELQRLVDAPNLDKGVFLGLPVVGPLIKRCKSPPPDHV
jgi:hypothetical protein